MEDIRLERAGSPDEIRRSGVWVLAAFWTVQATELTVVGLIQGLSFAFNRLPERVIIVTAGMALSVALVEFAARLEGRRFPTRLVATLAAALVLCAVLVAFAYQFARLPAWGRRELDIVSFVYTGFAWSWFFLAVAAAILALSYSAEARARGERLARLEVVARDARLAALRYQINPHFLFNTLNSVAGLIGEGQAAAAEGMVEDLSDFLRSTLELDPIQDIELGREAEFQQLYLAIEQARFPHRLLATLDIPGELRPALVPALILQPLVENTIRHAVAQSSGKVALAITARADEGWLVLRVEDDGGVPVGPASPGTGTGLRNVRERLAARFGLQQSLSSEPLPRSGHRTELRLPLVFSL